MRNGEISQRLEGGILFNGDNAVRRTQSGVGIEGQRAAFDIDAVLAVLPGEGERAGAKLVQRAVARNDARKRHIMAIGVNGRVGAMQTNIMTCRKSSGERRVGKECVSACRSRWTRDP